MKFLESNSDTVTLKELGHRILEYRLNRNQTQDALAQEARVSKRTVIRVEKGESTQLLNFLRILRVLRLMKNFNTWLAREGRSPTSFNPVERLCYTGARGMGALEYFHPKDPPAQNQNLWM